MQDRIGIRTAAVIAKIRIKSEWNGVVWINRGGEVSRDIV